MRWIIAERKNNKAIIVYNLHSKGVKVPNSFKSCKQAENFIREHSYNEYFPLLLIDSGISINQYNKKYPIVDEIRPMNNYNRINRVVPQMRIKTVSNDIDTKPAVKVQKTGANPAKKVESNPVVKPMVKTEPKPAHVDIKPAPKNEPKTEVKPVKKVESKPVVNVEDTPKDKPLSSTDKRLITKYEVTLNKLGTLRAQALNYALNDMELSKVESAFNDVWRNHLQTLIDTLKNTAKKVYYSELLQAITL